MLFSGMLYAQDVRDFSFPTESKMIDSLKTMVVSNPYGHLNKTISLCGVSATVTYAEVKTDCDCDEITTEEWLITSGTSSTTLRWRLGSPNSHNPGDGGENCNISYKLGTDALEEGVLPCDIN